MDVDAVHPTLIPYGLRAADEPPRGSEAMLRVALDAAALGAWLVDLRAGTVEWSPRCRELLDHAGVVDAESLVRRVHPDDEARVRAAFAAALDPSGPGSIAVDHRVAAASGPERWVRTRGRVSFDGVGDARVAVAIAGTVEDITPEVRAAEDDRFLLSLGALLPTISEPDEILQAVLERLAAYLRVPHALVVELDTERGRMSVLADVRTDGPTLVGIYDLWRFTTPARLGIAATGTPIVVDDTALDPRTSAQHALTYGALGIGAYVTSPQMREGHFVGGLTIADRVAREWTEREVALVHAVAQRLWTIFENARLLRAERAALGERDRLLVTLRQREAAFRAAFDHVTVGMAQLTLGGEFTRVNQAFCAMVGHGAAELVGRHLLEVTHPDDREGELGRLARLVSGEIPSYRREKRYVRRDGAVVWGEVSVTLARDDAGAPPYILAAITDITSRREADAHLAATAERIERLQRVTAQLSRAATVGQVCEALVTVGRQALDADAGLVVLLDDSSEALSVRRAFHYGPRLLQHWRTIPLTTPVPVVDAVRTCAPVWLARRRDGVARYPILGADAAEREHHAWAALPLVVESRALGAIGVSFTEPREFSEEYRAFAMALAQQCAQALERARLYEAERQARADAEDARSRAEAANRTKSDFLAVMSHELRTPLNAIGGYAQLLQMGIRGPVTPQQLDDLARIERSQRTLLGLINDVLSFAKLESGSIDYHVAGVPLHEALAGLETLMRPQMEERNLRYRYDAAPSGLQVRADRDRMMQILINLMTNAVKFTPAGGDITVWAEDRGSHAAVRVRDTGRGIPSPKLELIFQPFVQVDTRLTRESGGIGLGLAISRDLARAMGGDLTVESIEGEGATFSLTLPVVPVAR
jgi:PAS domain S-box-containing protein